MSEGCFRTSLLLVFVLAILFISETNGTAYQGNPTAGKISRILSTVIQKNSNDFSEIQRQKEGKSAPDSSILSASICADSRLPIKNMKWRHNAAILASAFCVAAIVYPFDLVRALKMANAGSSLTTAQLLINFKNSYGYKGFVTQGLAPELIRATLLRFIKFSLFPLVHVTLWRGLPVEKGSSFTKAIAAFIGSVPEVLTIMPLEIAKISLQLDSNNVYKNNMINAIIAVFKKQGLRGFTIGYLGVQLRTATWSAGYFASIDVFKKLVDDVTIATSKYFGINAELATTLVFRQLLSGFLAGIFGASLNTPFDTIRSSTQRQILSGNAFDANNNKVTLLTVGKSILQSKGFGGLYSGFNFKAVHLGTSGALMAVFMPFFKQYFENI